MLSEFSDFFRTPYVDQHAKEVPKNIVFGGAPFCCPAKAFKDTVVNLFVSLFVETGSRDARHGSPGDAVTKGQSARL